MTLHHRSNNRLFGYEESAAGVILKMLSLKVLAIVFSYHGLWKPSPVQTSLGRDE